MKYKDNGLYSIAQIREFERLATAVHQIPEFTLMQRAGIAAFEILRQLHTEAKKYVVVCGNGNNGGDGYIVAVQLHKAGLDVWVISLEDPQKLTDAALQAYQLCQQMQVVCHQGLKPELINDADVIVDAILGIGIKGQVRENIAKAIDCINRSQKFVFSVDVPSGIDADTGTLHGIAVRADAMITFIRLKPGLFTGAAADYTGQVHVDDIGLGQITLEPCGKLISPKDYPHYFKPRSKTAHKGDFGHVLIIGGDYGMPGAVCLAAVAAYRAGCGLVTVATRPEHCLMPPQFHPEIMSFGITKPDELLPLMERASVIALGPGLGRSDWSRAIFQEVLKIHKPLVVDADALNLLSEVPCQNDRWILTPHPKEAARLLQTDTTTILQNRFEAAFALQKKYLGTIVLKGAGTIVCADEKSYRLCPLGNPGMAVGGMGDALTGIIAGLAAQNIQLSKAGELGVWLHAKAGDYAVSHSNQHTLLALDLIEGLKAIKQ